MAAGSAAERAESGGISKARARGREVVLTFTMQVSLCDALISLRHPETPRHPMMSGFSTICPW